MRERRKGVRETDRGRERRWNFLLPPFYLALEYPADKDGLPSAESSGPGHHHLPKP